MKELTKILIIEDEPDIQEIARASLELVGGFTVFSANGGLEGIVVAADNQPDLILLDMMMPGIDGKETFTQLRSNPLTQSIPVVFMTAKVQVYEVESYLALGGVDVIPKPFDPMMLSSQVNEIWNHLNG